MQNKNRAANLRVWLIVLILFACVSITIVALIDRLNGFMVDDSGAMPLIPEGYTIESVNTGNKRPALAPESAHNKALGIDGTEVRNTAPANNNNNTTRRANPGFQVEDDKVIWSNNTQVDIFHISYKNGEQQITVNSNDGDKLIAPGTSNSYVFKLSNTGNVALDYEVTVEAFFSPAEVTIPVTARLSRYDGEWIVGDNENFADIPTLDGAQDSATLGAGRYTYYTLDWQWPFESGDDEYDTMLGNRAVDEDLTFTIVINTRAEYSGDADHEGGLVPTGDNSYASIMTAIVVGSCAMIIILLVLKIKEKKNGNSEGEQH